MLFIDYPDEEKLQDILSATETSQGFRNLVTLFTMMKEYKERKKMFVNNIKFDPSMDNLSMTGTKERHYSLLYTIFIECFVVGVLTKGGDYLFVVGNSLQNQFLVEAMCITGNQTWKKRTP